MDVMKTSSVFHLLIKIKYDVDKLNSVFAKPLCLCHSKQFCNSSFGILCEKVLGSINELVSMMLQALCETNNCLCFEHVYPLVDRMLRSVQPFIAEMFDQPQQFCLMQTVSDNVQLLLYIESTIQLVIDVKHRLSRILHDCSQSHFQLLSSYNVCNVCL